MRLTDPIPAGTVFEPGSLAIVSGPGAGPATDPAGDDLAEGGPGGVVFRLGRGRERHRRRAPRHRRLDLGALPGARRLEHAGGHGHPERGHDGVHRRDERDALTATRRAPVNVTVVGTPILSASKTATLAVDADDSGGTSGGDTLAYSVVVTNSGNQASTGTVLADTLDPLTRLVTGSVTTTQGTVASGNAAGQTRPAGGARHAGARRVGHRDLPRPGDRPCRPARRRSATRPS